MAESLSKYGFLRLGVVSPEMRIGDIDFNTEMILESIDTAVKQKCNILLFPELSLTGYSCGDLFFQDNLLKKTHNSINQINDKLKGQKIVVVVGAPIPSGGKIYNCAVVLNQGNILGIIPKTYLSNSNEYYEERWFSSEFDRQEDFIRWDGVNIPFGADILFRQKEEPFANFGIEICEDLWTIKPPSFDLCLGGAQILLNLSASNEYLSKAEYRLNLVKMQSARCFAAYAFSSCGPNESTTDTVFSGHSIIAEYGSILTETERFKFETQIAYADIDIEKLNNERQKNNSFGGSLSSINFRSSYYSTDELKSSKIFRQINKSPFVPVNINKRTKVCEEIFSIQSTGLAKRIRHIQSDTVTLGISGGLDSTLALLVAIDTFRKLNIDLKKIIAVSMPGFGTTDRTKTNAETLSGLLGITLHTIPINKAINQHFQDIKYDSKKLDVVFENAQARERTQILMDIANMHNGFVIGTGDLSEIALGWSTYNADHMSMYNVNSGVPKTLVKYIIQWAAEERFSGDISKILLDICNTPISPELLPADKNEEIVQQTEKDIGPFELHDFFLYYAIRMNFSAKKIIFLAERAFKGNYSRNEIIKWLKVFYQRFFRNQFKRSCMPDGVKVGTVALSPRADWRMPSDASNKLWLEELDELDL
ncbi:NAD(+) synthase [Bacteroidota bacterium]